MGWEKKPLEVVADFCLGKMLDQKKNKGELLPYLANVNVRWGSFDLDDLREMRFEHHELDRYGLKSGDIVMCEGGEPGRCALWKGQKPDMMIQKALHRIRPHNCLLSEFLFYYLLYTGRTGHLAPLFTGATIKHLPREKLAKVEVMVPPLGVQNRIASVLATYDDLIENNRRRIQLLEQSARLLYKEWFVRLRFPGHEHVKVKDEVPEGWERKRLSELCTDIRESIDPKTLPPETAYIGLEHIPRRSITLSDWGTAAKIGSSKFKFTEGDILFGKIRPYFHKVGFTLVGGITSSDAIVIRSTDRLIYHYVLFLLSSDEFVALASKTVREGSKMPRADWKFLLKSEFNRPAKAVLASFNDSVEPICAQLKNLALHNQQLTIARDLLLPRLMSGEVAI